MPLSLSLNASGTGGGITTGLAAWKLSYQISPIILNDGIATGWPGNMMPIIAITEAGSYSNGALNIGNNIGLDDFFANYQVIPGGTLIDQQLGHYPFANQAVAANAVIVQPLRVSLKMICPARGDAGYANKTATFITLKSSLTQHNNLGGTYTIITPAAYYTNCVMLAFTDASTSESKQVQDSFRLDFEKPLLTIAEAQMAYNSTMGKIANGLQTYGSQSGASAINQPGAVALPGTAPIGAVGTGTSVADTVI